MEEPQAAESPWQQKEAGDLSNYLNEVIQAGVVATGHHPGHSVKAVSGKFTILTNEGFVIKEALVLGFCVNHCSPNVQQAIAQLLEVLTQEAADES